MKKEIIIIRECEGHLSIMKEADSNNWLTFFDYHTATDYIQETIKQYKVGDTFHIVKYVGAAHIDEEVTRKLRRVRDGDATTG